MTLLAHAHGLVGVWFVGQKHEPALSHYRMGATPVLTEAQRQLEAYFAGRLRSFDVPLDLSYGTAFQQSVWHALRQTPCGDTISYSALALQCGKLSAVRAVANAVGRNPLSVVVPCHRIVGRDGSLTGYAGGLARKAALLELELRKP
jgi:methylated-DNA-[protein]-cysteine S-methyltransferase